MKNLFVSLALVVVATFVSCNDEPEIITETITIIEEVEVEVESTLPGNVTEDLTLDASTSYELTGSMIVNDGATLTIPAGTKITAQAGGTSVYIAVLKGGAINIEGTADNPVVMGSDSGVAGSWGGLTICGKAFTSSGATEATDLLAVGEAEAEVGGFIYGGSDATDNSGSIEYLVLRGTGAQINADSQYNGISFYAVGSGTTVNNIAVIDGSDDGVEFFGGSVEATNIYLENNQDDAVDWTEEWDGGVTNVYISHTDANFSTAFEGDKANGMPFFDNVTAISSVGGKALQFKSTSGGVITNLYLEGYDTNVEFTSDTADLSSVTVDGTAITLDGDYSTGEQVDISTWTWTSATL